MSREKGKYDQKHQHDEVEYGREREKSCLSQIWMYGLKMKGKAIYILTSIRNIFKQGIKNFNALLLSPQNFDLFISQPSSHHLRQSQFFHSPSFLEAFFLVD